MDAKDLRNKKGAEMSYTGMSVPFEVVPFAEMNKKQVKQYFDWYVDTIDIRIENLEKYINQDGKLFSLDKTPESLINLWEWFEPRIEFCPKTEEEIEAELAARPDWMAPHVLEHPRKISGETFLLGYDISAYFGEVVRANNPQIYWGYLTRPKRLHGVNWPRLLGFAGKMTEYTYGRVELCIWQSVDKTDKMYLYDKYKVCLTMI